MFKRVLLDDWHQIVPYLCFGLIAFSFLFILVKAFLLTKKESERLANLPLRDDKQLNELRDEER